MRIHIRYVWVLVLFAQVVCAGEIAVPGEPLKKSYKLESGYKEFYQTGKFADGYSMICDMGQAIPDPKRENWYNNKPIRGLQLELRARAAFTAAITEETKSMGFVVVVKGSDELIVFKPLGDYSSGSWDGDVFSSWSNTATDIEVYSERFGSSGYAHFDLLDGQGFFLKGRTGRLQITSYTIAGASKRPVCPYTIGDNAYLPHCPLVSKRGIFIAV